VVTQNIGHEEGWEQLGRVYFDNGKMAEAYSALREALKLNPFNRNALFLSAMIRIKLRLELKTAARQLEMAAALGHSDARRQMNAHLSGRHAA
jgi:cytochrome c-type biogenesis protein CcmH/NrfG